LVQAPPALARRLSQIGAEERRARDFETAMGTPGTTRFARDL